MKSMSIFLRKTNFNPLPRKEGDLFVELLVRYWKCNFNPLPRKEGDVLELFVCTHTSPISIHSLVKRET